MDCLIGITDAVLLGIVQGLTEFLPISSTAHLRIVPALAGSCVPGAAYSAVIQLGTLLAVLIYFAKDVGRIVAAVARAVPQPSRFKEGDARLGLAIALATLPIGVCGLLLKNHIVGDFRSLYVIGAMLIVVGGLMLYAERSAKHQRTTADLTFFDVQIVGLAQTLALIPGVSRSGITLAAALLIGMRRDEAARFSFMLSIPAVTAAGIYELKDVIAATKQTGWGVVIVGTLVSLVVGLAAIHYLIRFLKTRTTVGFVAYRVVLGVTLIALCLAGIVKPL